MIWIVLLAPLLALVGGLAVIAFTKLYSAVFLGAARSQGAAHPHEAAGTMLVPMGLFALLCLTMGLAPQLALRLVTPALTLFMPAVTLAVDPAVYTAILGRLALLGILLLAAVLVVALFWRWRLRQAAVTPASTWGCGYQRATARMEYTATAFSEIVVSVFNGLIRQRIERPALKGLFPATTRCADLPTETVLERIIVPLFNLAGWSFAFLRRLQHGQMHVYMIYIFATLFILMLWAH